MAHSLFAIADNGQPTIASGTPFTLSNSRTMPTCVPKGSPCGRSYLHTSLMPKLALSLDEASPSEPGIIAIFPAAPGTGINWRMGNVVSPADTAIIAMRITSTQAATGSNRSTSD